MGIRSGPFCLKSATLDFRRAITEKSVGEPTILVYGVNYVAHHKEKWEYVENLIATAPECQPGYTGVVGFPHHAKHYGVEYHVESVEHRENYSMGGGNYLKAGCKDSSGWKVCSYPMDCEKGTLSWGPSAVLEDRTTPPLGAAVPPVEGVEVSENDERDGVEIRFPGKPPEEIRTGLKIHGFRWSGRQRLWYARRSPARLKFAQEVATA